MSEVTAQRCSEHFPKILWKPSVMESHFCNDVTRPPENR